jgi:hypothetical protein
MTTRVFKIISLIFLFVSAFASCEVGGEITQDVDGSEDSATQDSFKDLIVANTFEWTTSQDITVNYKGVPLSSSGVKRPLIIKVKDGEVLRKLNVSLSDDISVDLRIPTREETLILSWGTLEKEFTLGDSQSIDFTFIDPDTADEG